RHARLRLVLRIGNARDRQLVLAGKLLLLDLAARLARLPGPEAIPGNATELFRRDLHNNRVRVRQDVIFLRGAPGIFAIASGQIAPRSAVAIIAGVVDRLRRPAEPALLVPLASGGSALVRCRGVLAVGVV